MRKAGERWEERGGHLARSLCVTLSVTLSVTSLLITPARASPSHAFSPSSSSCMSWSSSPPSAVTVSVTGDHHVHSGNSGVRDEPVEDDLVEIVEVEMVKKVEVVEMGEVEVVVVVVEVEVVVVVDVDNCGVVEVV